MARRGLRMDAAPAVRRGARGWLFRHIGERPNTSPPQPLTMHGEGSFARAPPSATGTQPRGAQQGLRALSVAGAEKA